MSLVLHVDGHPGQAFAAVVRELPDGATWLLSDLEGAVIIARSEGDVLREAILWPVEGSPGSYDIECLVSAGVSELSLQILVGLAGATCILSIVGVWLSGVPGLWGLILGICMAGAMPSLVLAVGQRILDPGRDGPAEAQLERALRFAAAHVPAVALSQRPQDGDEAEGAASHGQ